MNHKNPGNIVELLRQDSETWIQSLTEMERNAIYKYSFNSCDKKTNRFFERLNSMLRGDREQEDVLLKYADIISGALKKTALKRDVVCYRGVDTNPIKGCSIGTKIKLNQFTSTSVVETKVLKSDVFIKIYAPKGTIGAYIEKISKFPKQRELLLDKDCVYKVIKNYNNKVVLEVVVS